MHSYKITIIITYNTITPKIFCHVFKKRDMIYTTAQEMTRTLAFELSDTVQKKEKRMGAQTGVKPPTLLLTDIAQHSATIMMYL